MKPRLLIERDPNLETPRGQASVSWERRGGSVSLTVTLPAGTRAELCLTGDVTVLPAADAPVTRTYLVEE